MLTCVILKSLLLVILVVIAFQFLKLECQKHDDELRWLLALIIDTGMRLSEACGLLVDDINLCKDIPFLDIKPYSWRRLKTRSSPRKLPLVGISLWAAKQVSENQSGRFAFPNYCNDGTVKANSASASLNKWLKGRVPDGCVVHSLRHSFRDRLRDTECPSEIVDALGGWSTPGLGVKYGSGYTLKIKKNWMDQLD